MVAKPLAIVAVAAVLCLAVAGGQVPRGSRGHGTVPTGSCNESRIRTFLSGMSQGAGNTPGGSEFACRRVGAGRSAMVLVYSSDRDSCGAAGCTLLVLRPDRGLGYIVIGRIVMLWLPIRVLDSKSHGFYDLVAPVAGGGILPGYNAEFTYDGKSYPISGPSGTELPADSPLGTVVISKTTPIEVM